MLRDAAGAPEPLPLPYALQGNEMTVQLGGRRGELLLNSDASVCFLYSAETNLPAPPITLTLKADDEAEPYDDDSAAARLARKTSALTPNARELSNGCAAPPKSPPPPPESYSSLLAAATTGDMPALRRALASAKLAGADIDGELAPSCTDAAWVGSYSALHAAAADNQLEAVAELLSQGAKVNRATKSGQTALHIASRMGHPRVVSALLLAGADHSAVGKSGKNALQTAAASPTCAGAGCDEVKALLSAAAPHPKNEELRRRLRTDDECADADSAALLKATAGTASSCADIVKAKACAHEHAAKLCCESCAAAGADAVTQHDVAADAADAEADAAPKHEQELRRRALRTDDKGDKVHDTTSADKLSLLKFWRSQGPYTLKAAQRQGATPAPRAAACWPICSALGLCAPCCAQLRNASAVETAEFTVLHKRRTLKSDDDANHDTTASTMKLKKVDGSATGAVCMDGTMPGYYFRPSPNASTDWMVFLQGGGWVFDKPNSVARSRTNLGSSASWQARLRAAAS